MKNSHFLSLVFLFLPIVLIGQNFTWLSQTSNATQEYNYNNYTPGSNYKNYFYTDVSVDASDDIYTAGIVKQENINDSKAIVTKYDKNKSAGIENIIWEKEFNFLNSNSIADEFILTMTTTTNNTLIGGQANGIAQLIIVKNSTGDLVNRANIVGSSGSYSRIVGLSAERSSTGNLTGNIYAVGYFTGTIKFRQPNQTTDKQILISSGYSDIFIAKFTSTGAFINAAKISGLDMQIAFDIHTFKDGDLAISAYTQGSIESPVNYALGSSVCRYLMIRITPNFTTLSATYSVKYKKYIHEGGISLIHIEAMPNAGTGGCDGATDDVATNFRIDLNQNEDRLYYVINYKTAGGTVESKVGKLNNLGNIILEKLFPNLHFWDIKVSPCDSVYVSANSGLLGGGTLISHSDFNNIGVSHLLTLRTDNLTKTSELTSNFAGKSEQIEINNKGQVMLSGYYTSSDCVGLHYNGNNSVLIKPYECDVAFVSYSRFIGFVGLYHPGNYVQQNLITGPITVCPSNYPIKFDFSTPSGSNCVYSLQPKSPQTNNPGNTITFSTNEAGGNNLWISNLNGYNQPFYIYCECKQNCNDIIFDKKEVTPLAPLNINSKDITLLTSTVGGITTVTASYPPLGNPILIYMWQLFEGETTSSGCAIKGENNGTSSSYLIKEEYDSESGGISFLNTNLGESKSYVIKLGIYYQHPTAGTCGWYEARKCFTIASSSKKISEVKMINFKSVPKYQKQ